MKGLVQGHFSAIGFVLDRSLIGSEGVRQALLQIVGFCESEQVHVCYVELRVGDGSTPVAIYRSDRFGLCPGGNGRLSGEVKLDKTQGLYLLRDAGLCGPYYLPPGLSGLKRAAEIAGKARGLVELSIEVVRGHRDHPWVQWIGLTIVGPAGKEV